MTVSCKLDRTATLKILLHAAKYSTTGVNGFLIGRIGTGSGGDGEGEVHSPRGTVQVVDALPVLHNYITLTPMLEAALFQVRGFNMCMACM